MDMSIRPMIWACMSHLSKEERQEAVEMLVYIGLISSRTQRLDMQLLRQAFDKYKQLGVDTNTNNGVVSRVNKPAMSNTGRCYRLDTMSNYPFRDDYGTVDELLTAKQIAIPLQEMGAPARAKVIQVTYNSMLNGRRSMKLNDIPAALADLGLPVPSKILSIIHALGIELESVQLVKNTNVSISVEQFTRFVEVCLSPRKLQLLLRERQLAAAAVYMHQTVEEAAAEEEEEEVWEEDVRRAERRPARRAESRGRGGIFEETESSRLKKRSDAPRKTQREATAVDEYLSNLRGMEEDLQDVDYEEESVEVEDVRVASPRHARGGLLEETLSFRQKKRVSSGRQQRLAEMAVEGPAPTHYRDTHAMRLRAAKARSSAEILADKQRHQRSFQNLKIRVSKSPHDADEFSEQSNTSEVIESAEAFLRTSASMQPRSLQRQDGARRVSPKGAASDGTWQAAPGGWVADFGHPKLVPRNAPYVPNLGGTRNKSSLDVAMDSQAEHFHEKNEQRAFARYVPDGEVNVSHTVTAADPMQFYPRASHVAESKHTYERELMSSFQAAAEYDVSSDSTASSGPRPSPLKDKFEPSLFMQESSRASAGLLIPLVPRESKMTESIENLPAVVASFQSARESKQREMFSELQDDSSDYDSDAPKHSFPLSPGGEHKELFSDAVSTTESETTEMGFMEEKTNAMLRRQSEAVAADIILAPRTVSGLSETTEARFN